MSPGRTLPLLALLMLGAATTHPAAARQDVPDHPFFTGPVHMPAPLPFDLEHLRLDLRPEPVRGRISGTATLRLTPLTDSLKALVLHAADITVDSVFLYLSDSLRVLPSFQAGPGDTLTVSIDTLISPGPPFELSLYYRAAPANGLYFTSPAGPDDGGGTQVWTADTGLEQRFWFPTFDAPGDRLTVEMYVTVPPPFQVYSIGHLAEERPHADGTVTYHYAQDRPIPLREVGLVIGAYEVTTEAVLLPDVPVRYAVYPGQTDRVRPTFSRVPAMLRFFSERLGYPYPWAGLTLAPGREVPGRFHASNGLVLLDDAFVVDAHAAFDEDPDPLLARAVAHQWFGDLVSADAETDRWLDDAFPVYLGALFAARESGEEALALAMAAAARRYLAESARYQRPLVWDQWEDPHDLADAHSHEKGALVLHLLRHQIGEETFWRVLNRYLRSHDFSTVSTGDFQRAVESETHRSFQSFFDQWVYAAGHPVLAVNYAYDTRREELTVVVRQRQEGYLVPAAFTADVAIEAYTLAGVERFDVRLDVREQSFTFPLKMHPRFVVLDADQALPAEIAVDQPAAAWVAQLRQARSAVHRQRAARALSHFPEEPDLLLGLQSALQAEPHPAVRAAIIKTLGTLPPSPSAERILRTTLSDPSSKVRVAVLDALSAYAGSEGVAAAALEAANHDPSYRAQAAAVHTLVALGAAGAADVVRSALVTPSHREVIRRAAFAALPHLNLSQREARTLALTYTADGQPAAVRAAAVPFLRELAPIDRRVRTRLLHLLDDPSRRVRLAALEALAEVGSADDLPALEKRLRTERNRILREALHTTIGLIQAPNSK